jgi:hypothetical protein
MERLHKVRPEPGVPPGLIPTLSAPGEPDPRLRVSPTIEAIEDGPLVLHIHLISEDPQTEGRARQLVADLAANLKVEADFLLTSAPFEAAEFGYNWQSNATGGEDADILLVSAHGRREVPVALVRWIQGWVRQRTAGPRAVVISLDEESRDTGWMGQLEGSLQAHLRDASVDFFSHFGAVSGGGAGFSWADIQYRAETRTALLDETLQRVKPSSHWGINE